MKPTSHFLALSATMSLLVALPAYAQFSDVSPSRSDAEAIAYTFSRGIVRGYADGTFRPDVSINRAEFAKISILMFWNGEQRFVDMCDSVQFDDVSRDQWFFHFVCSAKDQGIVEGYAGSRTYGPGNSITVAEAAKMITKAFKIQTGGGEGIWYAPYIRVLAERHALPLNLPALDEPLTRGQLAEIVYRLGTNDTEKPTLTYGFLTGETNQSDPCAAWPEMTEIGDVRNPISAVYTHVPRLGSIFTAADCGSARLADFYGDLSGTVSDLRIVLKKAPSNAFYNALYAIGFAPTSGSGSATSLHWRLMGTVTIKQLLTLKPYAREISYDDCDQCG